MTNVEGCWQADKTTAQLPPGTYTAKVKITHNNGNIVELTKTGVVIENQYQELNVQSMTNHYPSMTCANTGSVIINVTGKSNTTYNIVFINTPINYTGPNLIEGLPVNQAYKIKNLVAGDYRIHVTNECGGLHFEDFTIVQYSDFPTRNLDKPIEMYFPSLCGQISYVDFRLGNRFFQHHVNSNNNYLFTSGNNIFTYYDFAIATRADVKKLETDPSFTVDNLNWKTTYDFKNGATLRHVFPTPSPTFQELNDPNYEYLPVRIYMRIKGTVLS